MADRIKKARKAYDKKDITAAKKAHTKKSIHAEQHNEEGTYLPDFVYGALDGTVTTFAVVAGVAGAQLSSVVILILGFANLFADGFSMAASNFLATRAKNEFYDRERKREEWEVESFPAAEREEIRAIYLKWGFTGKLLKDVVSKITSNKKIWVDVMMSEELGLSRERKDAFKAGLVTFAAFLLLGIIPLLTYLFRGFIPFFLGKEFFITILLTAISLFLIGAWKSKFIVKSWFLSGIETLFIGGLAASLAYLVGVLLRGVVTSL